MTIDSKDLLNSIMASLDRIRHIKPEEIPNIDMYMDQVTTFMEVRLRAATRDPGKDKILTKTMINNYAKNNLLPPPFKKKYNKEHMLLLIFIYYYKNVLSIMDIQQLLGPITDKYFGVEGDLDIESIYNEVFNLQEEEVAALKEDVVKKFQAAENTFAGTTGKEKEFLQKFSFICLLSYDVYVKKLLIEKVIDSMREDTK